MDDSRLVQASALLNRGRSKDALPLYLELINNDPNDAVLYQNLAVIFGELKKHSEALNMSKKALEINSNLIIPHITMAYIYDELGNKAQSREEARIAVERSPNLPEALCCAGILSLKDNKWEEAQRLLEKTVEISPSFYWAHYNLAAIYQNQKDSTRLARETVTLFKLKPSIQNLFRLIFIVSRLYMLASVPILLLSVILSLMVGARIILYFVFFLATVWFIGGVFLVMMAERRSWKNFFIHISAGIAFAIFGIALYLLMKTIMSLP